MELTTKLGKIKSIDLVLEDERFGLKALLALEGSSEVIDFRNWAMCISTIPKDGITELDQSYRDSCHKLTMLTINALLFGANKKSLKELVGVPIEATFKDRNLLQSFRILTEVL